MQPRRQSKRKGSHAKQSSDGVAQCECDSHLFETQTVPIVRLLLVHYLFTPVCNSFSLACFESRLDVSAQSHVCKVEKSSGVSRKLLHLRFDSIRFDSPRRLSVSIVLYAYVYIVLASAIACTCAAVHRLRESSFASASAMHWRCVRATLLLESSATAANLAVTGSVALLTPLPTCVCFSLSLSLCC